MGRGLDRQQRKKSTNFFVPTVAILDWQEKEDVVNVKQLKDLNFDIFMIQTVWKILYTHSTKSAGEEGFFYSKFF